MLWQGAGHLVFTALTLNPQTTCLIPCKNFCSWAKISFRSSKICIRAAWSLGGRISSSSDTLREEIEIFMSFERESLKHALFKSLKFHRWLCIYFGWRVSLKLPSLHWAESTKLMVYTSSLHLRKTNNMPYKIFWYFPTKCFSSPSLMLYYKDHPEINGASHVMSWLILKKDSLGKHSSHPALSAHKPIYRLHTEGCSKALLTLLSTSLSRISDHFLSAPSVSCISFYYTISKTLWLCLLPLPSPLNYKAWGIKLSILLIFSFWLANRISRNNWCWMLVKFN